MNFYNFLTLFSSIIFLVLYPIFKFWVSCFLPKERTIQLFIMHGFFIYSGSIGVSCIISIGFLAIKYLIATLKVFFFKS